MVEAIIFDLDGTLLDTSEDIQAVLNGCLKKYSLPEITHTQTLKFVGNGAKELVRRALGSAYQNLFDKLYADFSIDFANCSNERTHLYAGENLVLQKFKSLGLKLAIVTNKPQSAAQNVYNKHLKCFDFDVVSGQSDRFPLKPDPALTLDIIHKLGINPEKCLFVGDGETDVLTAKNAGIRCVSCLWGFRSKEQLVSAGGSIFVENYSELERFVITENFKNLT